MSKSKQDFKSVVITKKDVYFPCCIKLPDTVTQISSDFLHVDSYMQQVLENDEGSDSCLII